MPLLFSPISIEDNGKRVRKRQRTDSVEKLKAFENKVVIEIKLPDEMKASLTRDWNLINNEQKVNDFLFSSFAVYQP